MAKKAPSHIIHSQTCWALLVKQTCWANLLAAEARGRNSCGFVLLPFLVRCLLCRGRGHVRVGLHCLPMQLKWKLVLKTMTRITCEWAGCLHLADITC